MRAQVESPTMSELAAHGAPRAPNPILAVLGRALEAALNRLVDLDPQTLPRLAALEGRAVTIDGKGAAPSLRLRVEGGRLRVGPAFAGDSALRVAATPGALLSMALARGRDEALAPGRVEISGDAELARRLEQIATRFAPDFDQAFARAFGDVLGFQLARAVRGGLAWSRAAARGLAHDTAEYLSEEGRDLVARAELERFLDDVDSVRERADRLEARVRRLEAQHGTAAR